MLKLIKLIIWILILSGGIFFWNYSQFENTILTQNEETIEISSGGFQNALIDAGASPLFTKLYLSKNMPDFELQKWSYSIPANANVRYFLESLRSPINETDIQLRILEWWNIYDIDLCLSNPKKTITINPETWEENACLFKVGKQGLKIITEPLAKAWEFITEASEYEWFLYPDTYAINPNTFSVEWLIEKMRTNFKNKTKNIIPESYSQKQIQDLIILASIVEKEERNPEEKSTVAGILKKRLKEGWMIGADITVCYPYQLTSKECKLSVTKYLYEKNDYNTRQKTGLPAGPIGNPSIQTIEATLSSKDTPYYYYLHDTQTGKIYYGKTNAEHERNKNLYLR